MESGKLTKKISMIYNESEDLYKGGLHDEEFFCYHHRCGGGGKVHRNFMHSVSEKYTVVGVRGACGNQEK